MSFISLTEAREMVARYQQHRGAMLKEGYSTDVLPLNITIPKSEIDQLLNQSGASSCRIYFGMQRGDLIDVILVATDASGKDIVPAEDYLILDRGARCPHACPEESSLNP